LAAPTYWLCKETKQCFGSHHQNMTFFISVALAILAVLLRFLAYRGFHVHTGGYLILLIGYLVLLAGNVLEGA
jgi:hypothetical protein